MSDTPEHIQKLQLELWLAKTPGERLCQFLVDNDSLYRFWRITKEEMSKKYSSQKEQA